MIYLSSYFSCISIHANKDKWNSFFGKNPQIHKDKLKKYESYAQI